MYPDCNRNTRKLLTMHYNPWKSLTTTVFEGIVPHLAELQKEIWIKIDQVAIEIFANFIYANRQIYSTVKLLTETMSSLQKKKKNLI